MTGLVKPGSSHVQRFILTQKTGNRLVHAMRIELGDALALFLVTIFTPHHHLACLSHPAIPYIVSNTRQTYSPGKSAFLQITACMSTNFTLMKTNEMSKNVKQIKTKTENPKSAQSRAKTPSRQKAAADTAPAKTTKTTSKKTSQKSSSASQSAAADAKHRTVKKSSSKAPSTGKKPATSKKSAKSKPAKPVLSKDDIALRAYYISEKRRAAGLPGNEHDDWLEAERQLLAEATE